LPGELILPLAAAEAEAAAVVGVNLAVVSAKGEGLVVSGVLEDDWTSADGRPVGNVAVGGPADVMSTLGENFFKSVIWIGNQQTVPELWFKKMMTELELQRWVKGSNRKLEYENKV
jgi:hypothetical protein